MLKFFNKKKDNKGFTLVELVIVVAILAILVGLLAPQYTKYVEKSRKAADVSNLDNIVQGLKVAASDQDYDISAGDYLITISEGGTTVTGVETTKGDWQAALKEYTGYEFSGTANSNVKLKSKKWTGNTWTDTTTTSTCASGNIAAAVKIDTDGSVKVSYCPTMITEIGNKKNGSSTTGGNGTTGGDSQG